MFHSLANGSSAKNLSLNVFGGRNNLARKGNGVFLLGQYGKKSPALQYLNFDTDKLTHIMGDIDAAYAFSDDDDDDDDDTGGNLANKVFNSKYGYDLYINYRSDEDRLYFSEGTRLRYITTPTDTTTAKLKTLFTASRTISNYIFSEDKKQLFYISGGYLYCHDLSSKAIWCKDSRLGPATGLATIENGANQLTWMDDQTLLISNYSGQIYKYRLPSP